MPSLTIQEARARAALLTVDGYEIDFDLTRGPDSFRSTTTIRFTATSGAATFAELRPLALRSARLNGAALAASALADGRLHLTDLPAQNQLEVVADFPFSHASEGMHRFVDPVDGAVYLYAQPSITEAPAFMACFDQPDLKAPVTVRVTADPSWLVRGNGAATRVAPGRWELAPTPPLATYLIAMVAGPYHHRHTTHDGIPLSLYARASLAGELDREAPELFEVTAACLDHYHELFGIRYPFGSYDQAFVPELSWGAMELPGCVLVRDELVFRGAVTDYERERRAVLVAHEMAHMWFGNLVTMRWWDDLWLNESFADYLGWRVVADATRWRTAWTTYAVSRKAHGYAADQRPSTHPVAAAEVPDTVAALANFDGISYAKGSAVLRQLVAWVGDEAFLAGLRRYFAAHAYRNAALDDLLAALSAASGRDLTGWSRVWLREPQVNTLHAEVNSDGAAGQVRLRQTAPPGHPVLRPHRVLVGVYDLVDGALVRRDRLPVDLDPERDGDLTTVPGLAGVDGALVLVNDGDLTYAKVRLSARPDPVGLLPRLADPLARAVLWATVWDACRDGELPAGRFVRLAAAALPAETEAGVFESMLDRTLDPVIGRYLPPAERPAGYAALAQVCRAVLDRAEPGSGSQLAAARGLVRCAGVDDLPWLQRWLSGGAPAGLPVDPDLRWAILLQLAGLGAADEALIAAEQRRDPTARGVQEATRCRAARPDPAAKQRAWELVTADREHSNRIVVAAAAGFWHPGDPALTAPYVARYFGEIAATARWRPGQMLAEVTSAAYPGSAVEPATLAAAHCRLADDGLHPIVRREIVDATDDLHRAVAARELAARNPADARRPA
ncbi:MAG: aminopeptidase N [Micromonosporaceae bacterium]|nr:aminopeptidase N [Micromonosporaceae bacterium]